MNIAPTTLSMIFWSFAAIAFVATFVLVGTRYHDLPKQVPIHFGVKGKPDNWGGRILIWLPPISMLAMAAFVLALAVVEPPDEAREREAPAFMAFYIGLLSLTLTRRMIEVAMGRAKSLGWSVAAVLFVPLALFVIYVLR